MRPTAVLLGFLLGSAAAITFALGGVAIVFAVLRPEYPGLETEVPSLVQSLGVFAALPGAAGASFYGQAHASPWRRLAALAVVLVLVAVAWLHWPR